MRDKLKHNNLDRSGVKRVTTFSRNLVRSIRDPWKDRHFKVLIQVDITWKNSKRGMTLRRMTKVVYGEKIIEEFK